MRVLETTRDSSRVSIFVLFNGFVDQQNTFSQFRRTRQMSSTTTEYDFTRFSRLVGCIMKPHQTLRVRFGACKTGLNPKCPLVIIPPAFMPTGI